MLTAAAVILAGIVLFSSIPELFPRLSGHDMLADWIKENTNAKLRSGWIAPLIYPGVGVQVRGLDLELKGPEGHGTGEFFSADTIKIVADCRMLFTERKIEWREIIIEHPSIHLVHEVRGDWNVMRFAKSLPGSGTEDKEEQGFFRWLIKDSLKQLMPRPGTGITDVLAMNRLEIRDAEVHATDRIGGYGKKNRKIPKRPMDMRGVNLVLEGAWEEEPARFRIFFDFPQMKGERPGPRLELKGALWAESEEEPLRYEMAGSWSDTRIEKLEGWVKLGPAFEFDAALKATTGFSDIYRAATWPPAAYSRTIPDMRGSGVGRVDLHLWGPAPEKPFKVHYQGSVSFKGMTWDPGRVIAPLENVSATAYLTDGKIVLPGTTVDIADTKIFGTCTIHEAPVPRFVIRMRAGYLDFGRFFRGRRTPYKPGQEMIPMRTSWGGEFRIEEGKYEKIRLYQGSGKWNVTNKRFLTLPELTFKACNGRYIESGRSWIDFNHPTDIAFRFDGKLEGFDVTMFADQVFDTTTFLHGSVWSEGYITGRYYQGEFDPRSLGGELSMDVRHGYFEGFNLVGNLLNVFNIPLPEALRGQQFSRMTASVRFEDSVMYFTDLAVEATGLGAEAMGWIDFAAQRADLKIILHPRGPIADAIGRIPIVGQTGRVLTTLYVRASGHWDYLQYTAWNPADMSPPRPPDLDSPEHKVEFPSGKDEQGQPEAAHD